MDYVRLYSTSLERIAENDLEKRASVVKNAIYTVDGTCRHIIQKILTRILRRRKRFLLLLRDFLAKKVYGRSCTSGYIIVR